MRQIKDRTAAVLLLVGAGLVGCASKNARDGNAPDARRDHPQMLEDSDHRATDEDRMIARRNRPTRFPAEPPPPGSRQSGAAAGEAAGGPGATPTK